MHKMVHEKRVVRKIVKEVANKIVRKGVMEIGFSSRSTVTFYHYVIPYVLPLREGGRC